MTESIEIRNAAGDKVASLSPGDRILQLCTGQSTVDLRPLAALPAFEQIELFGDNTSQRPINGPTALLPEQLPDLQVLVVRGAIQNPEVLKNYQSLKRLNPGINCHLTDLSFVSGTPDLEAFEFPYYNGHIRDLSPLVQLKQLSTLNTRWGKYDLRPLGQMSQLRHLSLSGPAKGLHHIGQLENLEYLHISGFKTKHLNMLKGLRNLVNLRVAGPVADLKGIEGLAKLRELVLWDTRINDEALRSISSLWNLQALTLVLLNLVTDLAPLGQLRELRKLELNDLRGPIRSFAPFSLMEKLESLLIEDVRWKDQDLSPVLGLPNLRSYRGPAFSEQQAEALRRRIPTAGLSITKGPKPGSFVDIGEIRIHQPPKPGGFFFISQDLCGLLEVEYQRDADKRVSKEFAREHPDLAKVVEYDSEADCFVARSKELSVLKTLAGTIMRLIKRPTNS